MKIKSIMSLGILFFMVGSILIPNVNYQKINSSKILKTEKVKITSNQINSDMTQSFEYVTYDYEAIANEYNLHMDRLKYTKDIERWWLEYKILIDSYSEFLDPPETLYDYFTTEEIELIASCVETEGHGTDFESKTHIASVIFNRLESDKFPDNVIDIITATGQFCYHKEDIEDNTYEAIRFAFEIMDTTNGALYFHSNEKTNTFSGRVFIFTDNANHHFY